MVAACLCTGASEIEATIDAPDGGQVSYKLIAGTSASEWCSLAIGLAGLAAELRVYGSTRTGPAREDLGKSLASARKLVGTNPPWPLEGDPTPAPDFARTYEGTIEPAVLAVLVTGWGQARRLVRFNDARFLRPGVGAPGGADDEREGDRGGAGE